MNIPLTESITDLPLCKDMDWIHLRSMLSATWSSMDVSLTDSIMIQRQESLLFEIKNKLQSSSFVAQSKTKSKFGEQLQVTMLEQALAQIKEKCSQSTWNIIEQKVKIANQRQILQRSQKFEQLQTEQVKKRKQVEQMQRELMSNMKELQKAKDQISSLQIYRDNQDDERKKWRRKNAQVTQKEERLHKVETALLFKQKLQTQAKKKLNKSHQLIQKMSGQLQMLKDELQSIWQAIIGEMSNKPCSHQCWRKDVMIKCRQKLLEERNLLRDESIHLEKEYENMAAVAEQFKQLLQGEKVKSDQNISLLSCGGSKAIN